jgi:hypothetical protein
MTQTASAQTAPSSTGSAQPTRTQLPRTATHLPY